MKFLPILLLALVLLSGCGHDDKVIHEANQKELSNPTLVGTNSAGTKLYRLHIYNGNGESDYFYYWDK